MTNYFINHETVEEIKFNYRKLCMQHHPDRGGDTETMKEINLQYQQALESVDGQTTTGTDGQQHQYYYKADIESALMELINQLISLRMQDVEIALIGTWLWLIGSTKPYKEQLRDLGCRWHFKRKCWYFHTGKYRSSRSSAHLDELGEKYGSKVFTSAPQAAIVH